MNPAAEARCTYPACKCIVSTSTSQPEPICPHGLDRPADPFAPMITEWLAWATHDLKKPPTDANRRWVRHFLGRWQTLALAQVGVDRALQSLPLVRKAMKEHFGGKP